MIPTTQVPGIARRRVGTLVVTTLNDGYLDVPIGVMPGLPAEQATHLLHAAFRAAPPRLSVHAFLVQGEGRTILVDTGSGPNFGPTCGRLPANLAAAGVAPGEVDLILITHLHGDHIGGLATPGGQAAFPNAAIVIPEADAVAYLDTPLDQFAPDRRDSVQLARTSLAPYEGRITRLPGGEATPGITLVPLPGHTPGHSGYHISSDGEHLLIWADIVHVPAIQPARPDIGVGFDADPTQAAATRQALFARAADERLAVAGMHLDFPAFCHVVRDAEGYRLIPDQWLPFS